MKALMEIAYNIALLTADLAAATLYNYILWKQVGSFSRLTTYNDLHFSLINNQLSINPSMSVLTLKVQNLFHSAKLSILSPINAMGSVQMLELSCQIIIFQDHIYMGASFHSGLQQPNSRQHQFISKMYFSLWKTPGVSEGLGRVHQQNVNRSGSHTQTSQTFRQTSLLLPSNSRCSQAPLKLSKVLSDSARPFSGAPESTCSNGGAFRMLLDLTYRTVKL